MRERALEQGLGSGRILLSLYLIDEMAVFSGWCVPKDQDGKERLGHWFLWMDISARLSASAVTHGQDCQEVPC